MVLIDLYKTKEITDCEFKLVILSTGSIEYHGGVLPYGADSIIAERIINYCLDKYRSIEKICIYIYPTIMYGYSPEWINFPGTISLDAEAFLKFIGSIINSMEKNLNVNGYIFVNAHGGNYELLNAYSRELYMRYNKPFILIDLWRIALRYGIKYCHACNFEIMLYNYLLKNKEKKNIVDNIFCPEEDLKGMYKDYEAGYCGSKKTNIEEYVTSICNAIYKAIEKIMRR